MSLNLVYWTFSKATGEASRVGRVNWNKLRTYAEDEEGHVWRANRLFISKTEALKGASKYLDSKQRLIDQTQARIDRRRAFIEQQMRHCA